MMFFANEIGLTDALLIMAKSIKSGFMLNS